MDTDAIATALAEQAADRARRALEGQAAVALSDLRKLFEGDGVRSRSEAEIAALVAFRNSFCISARRSRRPG